MGPDLVGLIHEFITLGELSWADGDVDERHMELTELLVKGLQLLRDIKEESE